MQTPRRPISRTRLIGAVALVALVVAMVLNTKFLSPDALAKIGPKEFDPAQSAADLFAKARTQLPAQARPVTEVLPALQADVRGAAKTYKAVSPSEGSYDFAVTATGKVASASGGFLQLTVPNLPGGTPVLVPTTTAINGTVVRDALGFRFSDAPGQTEYQYVGDELKKLIQGKVIKGLGAPASLQGKDVTVVGVISVVTTAGANTVPAAKPANIQPVQVKVAP